MKRRRRLVSSISMALIVFLFDTSTGFGQVKFLGKGNVQVIQFSTNGEWLAIGTTAILEVYSTHTYQVICVIDVRVDTLDFSPNGSAILVGSNRTLHRFQIPSGREIARSQEHESQITDVAYSPDGSLIASVDANGVVRTRRDGREVSFREAASSEFDYWLVFSHDGRHLHVGTSGHVQTWNVVGDAKLENEWVARSVVGTPILHPDGRQLVFGKRTGRIEYWSSQTGEQAGGISIRDAVKVKLEEMGDRADTEVEIESFAFGRDGRTLVVGFEDAVLAVWDTQSQSLLHVWITKTRPDEEFKGWGGSGYFPDYEIRRWAPTLALSLDGRTVVARADRHANLGRWEVETGKLIGRFEGYAKHPRMIGFSADGSRFATLDSTVRVWNTATTEIIAEVQYDNGGSAAAISQNGKYAVITHSDRRVTVWEVDTATVKHVLGGSLYGGIQNWTVAFSPDSRLVAAVALSPVIRVWEVETGEMIAELNHWGDGLSFGYVRFSPDGKWLVGGGQNFAIWDTTEFALQRIIMTTRFIWLGSTVISPDSRWFGAYSGNKPNMMQFFDIETGKLAFELRTGVAATAEFSPDSRWLATWQWGTTEENGHTRYEPTMKFWDVENRRVVLNLPNPLYSHAMFSPDGRFIALNHKDHRIHLRSVETILPHYIVQRLRVSTWGKIKKNALFQNYPNPFSLETWIPYRLTVPSLGRINIYDVTGHQVRTLRIGMQREGNYVNQEYAAYWDGRDEIGESVAAGLYFYQLETDGFSETRRMVILK